RHRRRARMPPSQPGGPCLFLLGMNHITATRLSHPQRHGHYPSQRTASPIQESEMSVTQLLNRFGNGIGNNADPDAASVMGQADMEDEMSLRRQLDNCRKRFMAEADPEVVAAKNLNATLIAISPQKHDPSPVGGDRAKPAFAMLSDRGSKVGRAY